MTAPRHCLHVFSTFAAGGPQVRTAELLAHLEGYRHTVVAMDRDYECRERVPSDAPVEYLEPPALGSALATPRQMGRFIRAQAPDLVLTYNWGAIESIVGARLAGFRALIHGEDGFGPEEAERLKLRRVWARRVVFKMVSRVVVPSRNLFRILERRFGVHPPRGLYIPNGIDTDLFAPGDGGAGRGEIGAGPGDFVVGTVAKLRREKALDLLVRAFAEVRSRRPGKLVIVGDGPEQEPLQRLTAELGIAADVHFPGRVQEPVALYRAMDVFALSSVTEQMPISVVEAMACGRPVLATDVGDVGDMLAPSNRGDVLTGREVPAYAAALERLLDDPGRREAVGRDNREKCLAEYRRQVMLERYADLYRAVLEETGRR